MSSHCIIQGCKTTIFNKTPSVNLHPCPSSAEMRTKWLHVLKHKCTVLDWSKSRVCSKHFEQKCFDSQRRLKNNAIPTLFNITLIQKPKTDTPKRNQVEGPMKTKLDRWLNKLTQTELMSDIKINFSKLSEPYNLADCVTGDFKLRPDAPTDAKLWLLINKRQYLNNIHTDILLKNKKHVEILQKSLEKEKSCIKELEKDTEKYKYIIKCLQEKNAALEEQIEILSVVESR